MIYELRVYQATVGRMPELLKRFDTITIPIWERHGIQHQPDSADHGDRPVEPAPVLFPQVGVAG